MAPRFAGAQSRLRRKYPRPGLATGDSAKAERAESQSLGGDCPSEGDQQPAPRDSGAVGGHDSAPRSNGTTPRLALSSPSASTTGPREASDPTKRSEVACVRRVRGLGTRVELSPTAQVLEGGAVRRPNSAEGACRQAESGA